jgi:hypothetical protein
MTRTAGAAVWAGGVPMTLATVALWATTEGTFSQSGFDHGDGAGTPMTCSGAPAPFSPGPPDPASAR